MIEDQREGSEGSRSMDKGSDSVLGVFFKNWYKVFRGKSPPRRLKTFLFVVDSHVVLGYIKVFWLVV